MKEKINKIELKMFIADISSMVFYAIKIILFGFSVLWVIINKDYIVGYNYLLLMISSHCISKMLAKYSIGKEYELKSICDNALSNGNDYILEILEQDGFIKRIDREEKSDEN